MLARHFESLELFGYLDCRSLAHNDLSCSVVVTFGYLETPSIPEALALARKLGRKFHIMSTSSCLFRRALRPSPKGAFLSGSTDCSSLSPKTRSTLRNFHIPTGRVVEIGTQVVL